MSSTNKRCFRCGGQKKMFKMGGGYSKVDTGGPEVNCPLCDGEGTISAPAKKKKEADNDKKERAKDEA